MSSIIGDILNRTPVSFAAARTPVSFARPRARGLSRTEQLNAMGVMGTIFAIVTKLAGGTSSVDWHLYRKAVSGLAADRVEVTRHAALDLLNRPNPHMTRQEFFEVAEQHIDLTGESEWLLVVDERIPLAGPYEMWPIRPDRIRPIPDPETFLDGWMYTDPDGVDIRLNTADVIQVRTPSPTDPYRGMGPVQTILTDIEGAELAAQFNRNFFLNSAEPGGIIEVAEELTDDQFNRLRDQWNGNHRGVANAHRVAILEGGAHWADRSYSQKDMQFTELRAVSRELVREAFGFPKPMLGTVEDVNRANAEAAEYVFAKWCIVPRLERLKQALNSDLLPRFGGSADGLEFDYCNPVPEDQETENATLTAKTNAAVALVEAGFTSTDVLNMLGLPALGYTPKGVTA